MKHKTILTAEILKKKDWQLLTAGLLVEISAQTQVIIEQNVKIIAKLYNISEEEAQRQASDMWRVNEKLMEYEIKDSEIWPDYDHTKKEE